MKLDIVKIEAHFHNVHEAQYYSYSHKILIVFNFLQTNCDLITWVTY